MTDVKVNSITIFGNYCINNPIGICRDVSEEYFEIMEQAKWEPRRLAQRTWSQSWCRYFARKIKGGDRHLRKLVSRILRIAPSWRELQLRRIDCTCSSRIRSSSSKPFPLHPPQWGLVPFLFFLYAALLHVGKKWKKERKVRESLVSKNIFMELPLRSQASVAAAPSFCFDGLNSLHRFIPEWDYDCKPDGSSRLLVTKYV